MIPRFCPQVNTMQSETISFKADEKLKERLSKQAEEEMRTKASLMRKIVKTYLSDKTGENK